MFYANLAATGHPGIDWLTLTAVGVSIASAVAAGYLIIRLLFDLKSERLFREANVRRFRELTLLAVIDFLVAIYFQVKSPSSYLREAFGNQANWQLQLMDCINRAYAPVYMLMLVLLWLGFSLLLTEAIRIHEENQQTV